MLPSQLSQKFAKKSKSKAQEKAKVVEEENAEESEIEIPLHGLSSEDEDSSDDDDDDFVDAPAVDVSKLPTIAKDDATVKRKLEKAKMKRTQVCLLNICPCLHSKRIIARRTWRYISCPHTPWFLRGPAKSLLYSIRQCNPSTSFPE